MVLKSIWSQYQRLVLNASDHNTPAVYVANVVDGGSCKNITQEAEDDNYC